MNALRPWSLLVVDFDLFKPINDQYGQAIGDEVIQVFAERCRSLLRESDTPARIGGPLTGMNLKLSKP
ncbi:diguanylate cyclase [Idiomarina sp.]|uniref:diguanylate cyclase n=1 Tax=Idiomarina sp. TaxID=1874361 RepID=UPI003A92B6AA